MTYVTAEAFVRARGQVYRVLASQTIYAVLVLAGSWWGVTRSGLEGVAWGVGVAILVMWSLVLWFAVTAAGVNKWDFLRSLVPVVVPGVSVSATVWLVAVQGRASGLGDWGVILICAPVFCVLFSWHMLVQARHVHHPAIDAILARTPLGRGR